MGYVVKQRWLSGKGKKMWQSGDVVTERDFPENFQTLLKEGRIVQIEDSPEEIKAKKEAEKLKASQDAEKAKQEQQDAEAAKQAELDAEKAKEEAEKEDGQKREFEPLFIYQDETEKIEVFHESDLNKKQVIKHLAKLQIPFNPADKKEPLFNLILANTPKA